MKISAIRILNYKGFDDTGYIELNKDWNVIVGQNNAGKTAVIESFRLSRGTVHRPHRSIDLPRGALLSPISRFIVRMGISREWLKNTWLRSGAAVFDLPVGQIGPSGNEFYIDADDLWNGPDFKVELSFRPDGNVAAEWPSHQLFGRRGAGAEIYAQFSKTVDLEIGRVINGLAGANDSLPDIVHAGFPDRVYVFEAKRFAVGECRHEDTTVLHPSANNLPAVLIKLAGNPDLFREFNQNISSIFPGIRGITVTTKGDNFEIRVWSVDPQSRRDDLSVPLNESGTGVGQVLAITYVAMTNEPGVIAIDEPNSFLHPGAARKLIQILKHYPQHQYIISTHSPEVLSEAQPASLHMVRFDGRRSVVDTFGDAEIETKRMMLEEVGASLADVFSAEAVIWVEGPTERECFELIVSECLNGPIIGLSFVALRNTGDLDGKHAGAALEIYDALTQGGSVLPVSVWFSFDREDKTPQQVEDIAKRCHGRASFLPRRMAENYLLNPAAIAGLLNSLGEDDIGPANIETLLRDLYTRRMPKNSHAKYGSDDFFRDVDGANLLKDVFSEATEARQMYRKVQHGVELLKYILKESPSSAGELVSFVRLLVGRQKVST